MTRVVHYARYSTGKQSACSIEDHFRLCEEHAAREKWVVVGSYITQVGNTVTWRWEQGEVALRDNRSTRHHIPSRF